MEDDPAPAHHALSGFTLADLTALLGGGDLRSIGQADAVAALAARDAGLFGCLIEAMQCADPVLRARSADAAEKASAVQPGLLPLHRHTLLHVLALDPQPELRWHVAPMLARLPLRGRERQQVIDLLDAWLDDTSSIVKTNALQAWCDLARRYPALRPAALQRLRQRGLTGTPAMRARARRLLRQMGG